MEKSIITNSEALENIKSKIYEIRGVKVMLDFDLAKLYGIENSNLKKAVRRNLERFPDDFMFELTKEEAKLLLSSGVFQIGIPKYNFSAYTPFAFASCSALSLVKIGTITPPNYGDYAFTWINRYAVLKVPAGSIDAYVKAGGGNSLGWGAFSSIVALDE